MQALAEAARCRQRVLCVDAFAEMLQKVSGVVGMGVHCEGQAQAT